MESLEVNGKTVEEAVDKALEQLDLSREQVEIEVVKKGKGGFLGLGAEEARVRVTPFSPQPVQIQESEVEDESSEFTQVAQEALGNILSLMGLTATVELQTPLQEDNGIATSADPVVLNIKGDDLGVLIGRHGQTLASLQHIVRLIASHRVGTSAPLNVDVGDYTQRRSQSLGGLAHRLAERAASTGQSITLEPMSANERRIIHLALVDHPNVTTRSIGDDELRKVVVIPKAKVSSHS